MTDIHVYFVFPQNIENEDECDAEMQQAYNQCQLHKSSALQTEWLTADQCLEKTNFIKTDVIVLHEFKGPVYDKLHKSKATILGPRCLSCCLMEGSPIPPGPHPVFTIAMKEHVIAISGLSRQDKEKLKTKIQWMGGAYCVTLVEQCTHIIANNVLSDKYSNAVNANIPVMDPEWVNAVWKASLKENVLGSDPKFKKYALPPFFGLNITTSSLSKSEKTKIMNAVNSNGGNYTGSFLSEATDILITDQKGTQSDKYKACMEYNKLCLLPSWIYNSIERGAAIDYKNYTVSGTSTSSPNSSSRLPDMSLNLSTITNLRNPRLASLDESCSSMASSMESTRMTMGSAKKDITCSQRSRSSKMNAFNKESAQLVDGIDMKEVRQAGIFLDGCCIYVYGFTAARRDKLHRLVSRAGAIRYDNPQETVTHAICGDQSASITLKTSDMPRATHVRVSWLIDSMKAGKAIDEHQYSIQNIDEVKDGERSPLRPSTSSLAANASPMSKRNLQLLQARPPVPLFSLNSPPNPSAADDDVPADIMEQYTDKSQTLKADDDTLMEYVKQTAADTTKSTSTTNPDTSARADASDCVTRVKISNDSNESKANDVPDESGTMTDDSQDNNENLFEGLVFEMQGIDKPSAEDLIPTILAYGGTVVRRGNDSTTHVVVPVDYDPADVVNKDVQVVTTLWLSDCQTNEEVQEIKYHHRPVRLIPDTTPLAGLTLGISIYESNERIFIDELSRLMGAVTQQTFCRRDTSTARASTHLICPAASGPKYGGAVKWGLPAVNVEWLLECARKGRRVREGPYLIGETKEPVWNYEEDISIEEDETMTNADEKENFTQNENSPLALPLDIPDQTQTDVKTDSKKDCNPPIQKIGTPESNNTPKGKHGKLSLGGGMLSPASRYIAMARQGLLGSDTQETPKRSTEDEKHPNPNETMSTPPMDNALATPNLALFSPTTRRRLQAIKRGEMPSNPPKTPRNPFEMMDIATPESPFGAALRPETGHMSVESRKKLYRFCNNLPLPTDTCEEKRTPISELTKRFCSDFQNAKVTPLLPRQLHISDDEDTPPPSKQRKTSEMQSPSGNKTQMSPALESKLKQLDSILTGGNSTATTPRSLLGKRNMRTPPSHTKMDQQNMEPVVKSGSGESQTDTVGWDDMSVSGGSRKPSSSNRIPPIKIYKFIFSTNVSNRSELEQIIRRLGGTVAEEVDSTVTHTLCNKPNRSEKVMASIAAGVLLIHPSYISRSQEAGRFLDENPFVWGSTHAEAQVPSVDGQEAIVSMAAQRWHAKIREGNPPPFHNLVVIVHVSPDKRPPLVKLLILGGAILLDDSIPPKEGEVKPTCCIAELPKRSLAPDALKYLVDNRIPLCPSTYLAKLLMEENLEPAMHYVYPDFRRMIEES